MVEKLHKALPATTDHNVKSKHYREVIEDIKACLQGEHWLW
jgi:dihydroneopterin aldolase